MEKINVHLLLLIKNLIEECVYQEIKYLKLIRKY